LGCVVMVTRSHATEVQSVGIARVCVAANPSPGYGSPPRATSLVASVGSYAEPMARFSSCRQMAELGRRWATEIRPAAAYR
jgi:hypothetical protein